MDNVNPQLGKSTWWTGNHVPRPTDDVSLNNMPRKIHPDFSGCSWHVRSFLLLNRQRLNRRKLPLSRSIIIEDLNLQKKFHTVTFIIKEYAGKLNLLLFTYPVDKSTLLKAKVLLVAFSGIGGMLLGSALIFLIFFITERIFPLVPDTFSFGNIIKIWSELLLCSVYALCVGIVATKIGFIKMSVQTTIVSAIIIASCSANVISTMSYTNFPFLFLWGIMAIISIISYCNIVHKTIRMDI